MEIPERMPTWVLEPQIFKINEERMVLTSINVETKARKSACQRKAKKFCFAIRSLPSSRLCEEGLSGEFEVGTSITIKPSRGRPYKQMNQKP